jgi:hypothetical protein
MKSVKTFLKSLACSRVTLTAFPSSGGGMTMEASAKEHFALSVFLINHGNLFIFIKMKLLTFYV